MLFVGIDWAEERHRVILMDAHGTVLEHTSVTHDQPGLSHLDWLLTHGQPLTEVHVAIELHDSLLLDRLLRLGVQVYGLNPQSAQRARERFTAAGLKDDQRDSWSLAEFLRTSYVHLRPLQPDSDTTRALREWVALREDLVQERTVQIQRLRNHLVRWHPHILAALSELHCDWVLDLLERCPTADAFAALRQRRLHAWEKGRRLHPATRGRLDVAVALPSATVAAIRNAAHAAEVQHRVETIRSLNRRLAAVEAQLAELVEQHPDAPIFRSLPHAGTVTAAAMIAGFGEDRQRWNGHQEVAARWGVAPITKQSGKHRAVHRRAACDTTLHQAWLWFAFNTIRKAGCWAREDYQVKRQSGTTHFTALRGLGERWVKIAYRCWQDRVLYDEAYHQQRRAERQQPRMTK
jgi:transposase